MQVPGLSIGCPSSACWQLDSNPLMPTPSTVNVCCWFVKVGPIIPTLCSCFGVIQFSSNYWLIDEFGYLDLDNLLSSNSMTFIEMKVFHYLWPPWSTSQRIILLSALGKQSNELLKECWYMHVFQMATHIMHYYMHVMYSMCCQFRSCLMQKVK